jgi:hypothetical protein
VSGDPERTRGRKYHLSFSNMFETVAAKESCKPVRPSGFQDRPPTVHYGSRTFANVRAVSHANTFRPPAFANVRHSSPTLPSALPSTNTHVLALFRSVGSRFRHTYFYTLRISSSRSSGPSPSK